MVFHKAYDIQKVCYTFHKDFCKVSVWYSTGYRIRYCIKVVYRVDIRDLPESIL